jgi:hypothetical protein
MNQFVIFMSVLFALFVVVLIFVGFFVYRRIVRHSKQVERSLKFVPLLIKLPPQEINEAQNRDEREMIKESVSRAEQMFNLLSGIVSEKAEVYGRRHIAFEIIAEAKQIYFYTSVPASLISTISKALAAGYPGVQVIRKEEINLFSQVSKIAGVTGGELKLAKDAILPISTYKTAERDAIAGMLAGLSNLDAGDAAAIQILVRPAPYRWVKRAHRRAKYYFTKKKQGFAPQALDFAGDVIRSPLGTKEDEKKSKEPNELDKKRGELVEDKVRLPAFECNIRLVASSDDPARAKLILQDMLLGFAQLAQYDANRFKFVKADSPQELATNFIFRFFREKTFFAHQLILNSAELATIFHIPSELLELATPIERRGTKEIAAPSGMPATGLLLGTNVYRATQTPIYLSDNDRRRHLYVIGQTGTGKSTFLENLMLQDAAAGKGFAFIDPHGDTAEKMLGMIPPERAEDVIYFSPGDTEVPLGFNMMEYDPDKPEQKDFLIQEAIQMLYKLYDPQHQGIIGPRYEHWFRNAALTVMADPEGGTFIEIPKVFTDDEYLKKKFRYVTDPTVQDFWTGEMAQTDAHSKSEMLGWFVSKFGAFANNEIMRNIIGQKHSAFKFREVMDTNKILLVNLSKGLLGDLNAKLLGMIMVIKFQMAAMSRADTPEEQRPDFSVYVDEFQNFSTDSFATILSEARKYRLSLIVANQFISQLDEQVRDAVFGNVGSLTSFRVGTDDAEYMEKQYQPQFDKHDLINIPNFKLVAKIMANGVPTTPFSLDCQPPIGTPNPEILQAMKDLSRSKYGRPKSEVAAEIMHSLDSGSYGDPQVGQAVSSGMGRDSSHN